MKLTKHIKLERNKVPAWRHMPFGYYKNRPHILRLGMIGRVEGIWFVTDNAMLANGPTVKV